MATMNVVVRYNTDVALVHARQLNENEKSHYSEEYKDHVLVAIDQIKLPFINVWDLPKHERESWYSLPGGSNTAYEVSDEEWKSLIQLNEARASEKEEEERRERVAYYEAVIRQAEAQKDIPSALEAAKRRKEWNNIYNEGGEGYAPTWITAEQYKNAKEQLTRLTGRESRI